MSKEIEVREVPVHVLVEVSADGHIQVYGPKHANVKIINRPVARSIETGVAVDKLIDACLPFKYKDVYYPSAVRARGNMRRLTVGDIQDKLAEATVHYAVSDAKSPTHRQAIFNIMEA